jgi:hypothetical protein
VTAFPDICAQTLHGYARGHCLLAHSGELHESELHELDRLSDLSGYLPADAHYDAYHTGFPCGRYYALACTWPDDAAPRRGTVLTHTLLIPRDRWREDDKPLRWFAAHRRPRDAQDLAPYQSPVLGPASGPAAVPPAVSPGELRALLWLWFGQAARPLLWVENPPPLRVVLALWPWLWSEARESLAFCTFALQARRLRRRPFDLLGVPAAAVGAFHELSPSPAWWLEGRLRTPADQEPWLDELIAGGPHAVAALIERLRKEGLDPPPSAGFFRAAQRYLELEEGARLRLPAARARLDMLGRVWPGLRDNHPAVVDAIEHLLLHQPAAPIEPRPLWDLNYLLAARAVQRHVVGGTALGEKILSCLREQIASRLRRAGEALGDEIGRELAVLYQRASGPARAAIVDGIVSVASGFTSARSAAWAAPLLDLAAQTQDRALEGALWRSLPIDQITGWLGRHPVADPDPQAPLRERATELALTRQSPEIAFAAWTGDSRRGLAAAASVVQVHSHTSFEFEVILRQQEPAEQLEWCLACTTAALNDFAVRVGTELILETKPDIMQLAARCENRPLGPAIFTKVCAWAPDSELSAVFARYPALAQGLVRQALRSTTSASPSDTALRLIPAETLWDTALLAELTGSETRTVPAVIGSLTQRLLGDVVAGHIASTVANTWLREPHIEAWLCEARDWDIERPLQARSREGLQHLIQAVACNGAPALGAARPLQILLARATSDELARETEALLGLLDHLDLGETVGILIRAELLGALRYAYFAEAWRLVEASFAPVYKAAGSDRQAYAGITWWRYYSPDRQKYWRHWLLNAWIAYNWPRDAFVRCIDGDRVLAGRIFKRARKLSSTSRTWLETLGPSLRQAPSLYLLWEEVAR